jgi:hypothetical protein
MKAQRQQLRDALLLQAQALCALWCEEESEENEVLSPEASGGGCSSGILSSGAVPHSTPAAKAFIACGTSLRR